MYTERVLATTANLTCLLPKNTPYWKREKRDMSWGGKQRVKILRVGLSYFCLAASGIPISISDLSDHCEIINSVSWQDWTYDNVLFEGITNA